MMKHYKICVLGLVQGVWFRKYTLEAALEYDLVGFVKNETDGSVFIEVEGKEVNLQPFLKWLHTGSPLSEVKEIKWEESDVIGYSKFEISR